MASEISLGLPWKCQVGVIVARISQNHKVHSNRQFIPGKLKTKMNKNGWTFGARQCDLHHLSAKPKLMHVSSPQGRGTQ